MMDSVQKTRLNIGLTGSGFMGKTHGNAYHCIPYIFHGYRAILIVEAIRLSSQQGRKVCLSELDVPV